MTKQAKRRAISTSVVAVVIVVIICTATAGGGMLYYFRSHSSPGINLPASNSANTSSTNQINQPQSSTQIQAKSTPYTVEVTKVVSDSTDAQYGYTEFLLTVDASYYGTTIWNVTPSDFELVTNTSSVYKMIPYAIDNLNNASLLNGQQYVAVLPFLVPNGQIPSTMNYIDVANGITIQTQISNPTTTPSAP